MRYVSAHDLPLHLRKFISALFAHYVLSTIQHAVTFQQYREGGEKKT